MRIYRKEYIHTKILNTHTHNEYILKRDTLNSEKFIEFCWYLYQASLRNNYYDTYMYTLHLHIITYATHITTNIFKNNLLYHNTVFKVKGN